MKILLLGVGLQGSAALFDLIHSEEVRQITAADWDLDRILATGQKLNGGKVKYEKVDASDLQAIGELLQASDAVINLMPGKFRNPIARAAIRQRCHYIDASYSTPEIEALDDMARDYGVCVLPECGLDPGIDYVLAALAVSELDTVLHLRSYGAGVPDNQSKDNPLAYKISWTFEGVLSGYYRPARIIEQGLIRDIPPDQIFLERNVREIDIEGLGSLETYPNGDAVRFIKRLGISETVQSAGRYSMRWPGHAAFWRRMVGLGFLAETHPTQPEGEIPPRKYLHDLLVPQLQYAENERDVAIVRVEAEGLKDGRPARIVYQVIDFRDLETGLLAMQRTVGFTTSIGAQMILRGEIKGPGVLSPLKDVPAAPFIEALKARDILVQRVEEKFV